MAFERLNNLKELEGETVDKVDDSACNVVTLTTKSGKTFMLEAENVGPPQGLLGIVGYKQSA